MYIMFSFCIDTVPDVEPAYGLTTRKWQADAWYHCKVKAGMTVQTFCNDRTPEYYWTVHACETCDAW